MEPIQLPLPGFPVRIVVAAIWNGPEARSTIRACVDAPSDEFSSQMVGTDTEGIFTSEELLSAMETMLEHVTDECVRLFG